MADSISLFIFQKLFQNLPFPTKSHIFTFKISWKFMNLYLEQIKICPERLIWKHSWFDVGLKLAHTLALKQKIWLSSWFQLGSGFYYLKMEKYLFFKLWNWKFWDSGNDFEPRTNIWAMNLWPKYSFSFMSWQIALVYSYSKNCSKIYHFQQNHIFLHSK